MPSNIHRSVLGIKYPGHDSAAALVQEGRVIAAVEQERFDRQKHSNQFPEDAIRYCLEVGGVSQESLRDVAYYCSPELQISHLFDMGFHAAFPDTTKAVLAEFSGFKKRMDGIEQIRQFLPSAEVHFVPHHFAHAASAYFPSGFSSAAVLTIDGRGEYTTCEYYHGEGGELRQLSTVPYPHSIGFVYGAISEYLGLSENYDHYGYSEMSFDGEGKLMALAAYGRPVYLDLFRGVINYVGAGAVNVDVSLFNFFNDFSYGLPESFFKLFGPPRKKCDAIDQRHMDIACSLQLAVEECVLAMLQHLHDQTHQDNLCLAGGVFLNSCLNGAISRSGIFSNIFIQPAAGDAGSSVGAALAEYYRNDLTPNISIASESALLGPRFDLAEEDANELAQLFDLEWTCPDDIVQTVAKLLATEATVGWFQGRMEFGPRALGNRSILADPRVASSRDRINSDVKGREWFRPLAASVMEEHIEDFFESYHPSPHMLLVCRVKEEQRKLIPAVIHIDGTSRVQTVNSQGNSLFYSLLREFRDQTGIPVLINTSLNRRGMPLCCSPMDAASFFSQSPMTAMAIGQFLFHRK